MRTSALAVFAAGSVFALTAAGASTLDVTSAPAPAGGTVAVPDCTASATVAHVATPDLPSVVHALDITPSFEADACATLPALIRITAGTETAYAYRGAGLGATGTPNRLVVQGELWQSPWAAIEGTNPGDLFTAGWTVSAFTSPTVSITIAHRFASAVG